MYLLNRSPIRTLSDLTPYEAWWDKKPNIDHLRVFGCIAHMKIPNVYVKKLDDKKQTSCLSWQRAGYKSTSTILPLHKNNLYKQGCSIRGRKNFGNGRSRWITDWIHRILLLLLVPKLK